MTFATAFGVRRVLLCCALFVLATVTNLAAPDDTCTPSPVSALEKFFAIDAPGPREYRAFRHLEARSDQLGKGGWMDVWTEAEGSRFRYDIVADGGSSQMRSRVFLPALDAEREMWMSGAPDRATINRQNYTFQECMGSDPDGLSRIRVRPRRKDVLLVEGSIFIRPEDGELVRLEGLLSKTPSFWTRRVEVVRSYERIAGVRVPVSFETTASVLLAGKATFKMSYTYESINRQHVGEPAAWGPRFP